MFYNKNLAFSGKQLSDGIFLIERKGLYNIHIINTDNYILPIHILCSRLQLFIASLITDEL